jgi:predicted Rossmann fold nucleotide-binding protein DprA/Smf involved in DNA uptake
MKYKRDGENMTDAVRENRSYTQEEKAYMNWLYRAAGLKGKRFFASLERLGTPQMLYEMIQTGTWAEKTDSSYRDKLEQMEAFTRDYDVQGEYERMLERGIRFITVGEAGYPDKLAAISDRPYGL